MMSISNIEDSAISESVSTNLIFWLGIIVIVIQHFLPDLVIGLRFKKDGLSTSDFGEDFSGVKKLMAHFESNARAQNCVNAGAWMQPSFNQKYTYFF